MSQARGSAAGSVVSYLLGLTVIDPLRYNLLFERFLNRERKSMPDIDLDFADDRREEVIQYCRDKYGADHVAQIIAFGTMAAKAAVRDAGRALEYPLPEVDRVAKLIPTVPGTTLTGSLDQHPRAEEGLRRGRAGEEARRHRKSVEGLYRHATIHAAGVVITEGAGNGVRAGPAKSGTARSRSSTVGRRGEDRPAEDGLPRAAKPDSGGQVPEADPAAPRR